jgi:hypothetical protein
MTRIVSYAHRYKRPPKKKSKGAPLAVPAIVATKKNRALPVGRRLRLFQSPRRGTTGQRNPAHRAMRNVTAS